MNNKKAWDSNYDLAPVRINKQGFIINQFLGLGDILFLVQLIRYWMGLGHDVIWPIADEYYSIKRNFPDIQFVRKSEWKMNYEERREYWHQWSYGRYMVKPLRWNLSRVLHEAMTTKYTMYGQDWKMWRGLSWERDTAKENELMELVQAHGEYELICNEGGNITDGGVFTKQVGTSGLPQIILQRIPGFTLLDWSLIIENATIIHAVSSSTLYLFETLNLKAKEIHLYSRKAGMNDFEMVRPLCTKDYIYHV